MDYVAVRRLSVEEPILHNLDSLSVSSEVELADTSSPQAGEASTRGTSKFGLLPDCSPRAVSDRKAAQGLSPLAEEELSEEDHAGTQPAPHAGLLHGTGAKDRAKPLTLLPLIALIFFDVSGGPYGIEDAVSKGAPLLAIIGFLVLPLIWSVPEAMVTAELATTFPENSGYVAWVTAAFGPFWGFQKGFYAWVSGVTDNAVYPVLFLDYLQVVWPVLASGWARTLFLVSLNLALTYLNYRGLHVVGEAAVAMTIFTMLPFAALCILGLPHVKPANWTIVDWNSVQWLPFLNVMFWNLNYWDSVSTLAGEVHNPGKTFPRALTGAVVLVVLCYLLPLLVALGVTAETSDWRLGYFAAIGEHIGGKWLAWWIVAAAAVSQVGQFEAEMSSDSYQLQGMSERGFLPAIFNQRSKYGTPVYGILASSLGIMGLASFNFLEIVELLNCVYCMGQLLEFVAFIWLRIKYANLHRPYRIPLPTWACIIGLFPACVLLAGLLIVPWVMGDMAVIVFTFATVALGCMLHPLLQVARKRGWCKFEGTTPSSFKEMLYTIYDPSHNSPT